MPAWAAATGEGYPLARQLHRRRVAVKGLFHRPANVRLLTNCPRGETPQVGPPMGLLISIIIGGIIGWLASLIMKTDAQMGILANVVVGIVGSALGHFLAGAPGLAAYRPPAPLPASVGGAGGVV